MRILVSGSTGFVGSALVQHLTNAGHEVIPLVRSGPTSRNVSWDPSHGQIESEKLQNIDAVVHLAGESISGGRWTAAKKVRIVESRVKGTSLVSEAIAKMPRPPQVLVSASAVGYYGDRGGENLREESSAGRGFLAEACTKWEASTEPASRRGIRVVRLRIGIVLGPGGGALAKMMLPFKVGIGGKIGPGTQYMSWIAREDLCRAILHVIQTGELTGPVNGVAPKAVTNLEFTKTLGKVLHRPTIFPLPAIAARLVLGEMADELLLAGQKVEPAKLLASGFTFKFNDLESALRRAADVA